jgi:bifunctional DNA-binding transcriptional regulator/antitoxin component of YhaV-PrlF toxin-antitoxin module
LGEELIGLGVRSASQRGGSISVTIPSHIAKLMNIEPGDSIAFFFDPKNKRLILEKVSEYTTPSGLSFSISKELAKKLLKEEEKRK